jgi:hypothetical protein
MTIQPTHAADDAAPRGAASTTGRVAVSVSSDPSMTPISSASAPPLAAMSLAASPSLVSSHPRLDAMIASAPSVTDAAAGVHPHPDGIHASSESPLIFPLPPLDGEAWTHPLFPGEHSASGPQGVAPPVQVTPPPAQNRVVDVLAALVIDLAVLGLLGYLVSRGHLRIDFAGIMALVGLVLHHRRAVPVLPRLFPR